MTNSAIRRLLCEDMGPPVPPAADTAAAGPRAGRLAVIWLRIRREAAAYFNPASTRRGAHRAHEDLSSGQQWGDQIGGGLDPAGGHRARAAGRKEVGDCVPEIAIPKPFQVDRARGHLFWEPFE